MNTITQDGVKMVVAQVIGLDALRTAVNTIIDTGSFTMRVASRPFDVYQIALRDEPHNRRMLEQFAASAEALEAHIGAHDETQEPRYQPGDRVQDDAGSTVTILEFDELDFANLGLPYLGQYESGETRWFSEDELSPI